jgi:uncharacterized membrane protein (UPF0127 family)
MLKAKVADTPHALQEGLMFVKDLPQDEGMLFVFPRAGNLSFWGRNTFLKLDIAFIDSTNTIKKIGSIEPFSLDSVKSDVKCTMAIEANGGYFEENGITVGDKVSIFRASFDDPAEITFRKTSKDLDSNQAKIKESQVVNNGTLPPLPQVGAPNVGEPIQQGQEVLTDSIDPQNLPTLDTSDIGQYLEDALEGQDDQISDSLDGRLDQQPQPDTEDSPEEQQNYPVFDSAFDAIDWATQNDEVVRINYTTKKGTASASR